MVEQEITQKERYNKKKERKKKGIRSVKNGIYTPAFRPVLFQS
jgi:hypothetical protein